MKMNEQEIIDFIENGPELAEERGYGIDLWALWANLQRTPEERLYRHQAALNMVSVFSGKDYPMQGNLFELLKQLTEQGVDFVVIGGFAAMHYGAKYITQDIDICLDFTVSNLLKLQKALAGFHPVHRMTPSKKPLALNEQNCRELKNLYLDTDLGQLDCISRVLEIGEFQEVKKRSQNARISDTTIRILDLDAVIQSKKALHRPKDREVMMELEAIQKQKKETDKK